MVWPRSTHQRLSGEQWRTLKKKVIITDVEIRADLDSNSFSLLQSENSNLMVEYMSIRAAASVVPKQDPV